jgi:hypothetical protein
MTLAIMPAFAKVKEKINFGPSKFFPLVSPSLEVVALWGQQFLTPLVPAQIL